MRMVTVKTAAVMKQNWCPKSSPRLSSESLFAKPFAYFRIRCREAQRKIVSTTEITHQTKGMHQSSCFVASCHTTVKLRKAMTSKSMAIKARLYQSLFYLTFSFCEQKVSSIMSATRIYIDT